MYKLVITPEAMGSIDRIYYADRGHFLRIDAAIESLKEFPFSGKPLKHEFKGQYSLRVGFYRIIYAVNKFTITVTVLDIGHRRNIYN